MSHFLLALWDSLEEKGRNGKNIFMNNKSKNPYNSDRYIMDGMDGYFMELRLQPLEQISRNLKKIVP